MLEATELITEISDLHADPLGCLFVQRWNVPGGEVRWIFGMVQERRIGQEFFSFPVMADEFLERKETSE